MREQEEGQGGCPSRPRRRFVEESGQGALPTARAFGRGYSPSGTVKGRQASQQPPLTLGRRGSCPAYTSKDEWQARLRQARGPDGQRQRREKHPCRAPEGQRPVFRCAHRWPSVSRRYPIGSGARCTGGPRRSRSGGDGRFTGTPACSSGGRSRDLHGPCDMATTAANLRRLQDAISNLLRFRPRASRAGGAWLMRLFPRCAAFASLPSSGPTSWRKR